MVRKATDPRDWPAPIPGGALQARQESGAVAAEARAGADDEFEPKGEYHVPIEHKLEELETMLVQGFLSQVSGVSPP